MALTHKLASFSSLFSPHSRNHHSLNPHPICSLKCDLSTSLPFTEKHSIERYQREQWVYEIPLGKTSSCPLPSDSGSIRESEGKCNGGKCAPGNVFLVGTGPGDPELLTLKAARVIESVDLLLYDRLVSNDVLDLAGSDAKLLYVGKTAGYHSRTQEEKHELFLSLQKLE